MSFTTSPKAPATPSAPPANDARSRAIAKFNQGLEAAQTPPAASQSPVNQSQPLPVQNASKVSPEEMGALKQTAPEGQSDTIEPPKEPVATEPKKAPEEPLSTQFAILARKEKAHRNQVLALQADMKAKEAALAAREDAIKAKEAAYQTDYIPKSALQEESLWDTLASQGITYDQVTQQALNRQNQDPAVRQAIQKLQADMKAELQAIRDAQDKTQKAYQEQQTQAYQQAIQNITTEVKSLVNANENFELVKSTNSVKDVVDLIERSFKEGISDEYPKGVIIPTDVAAQMVEDYLLDEALKISSLKKIQSRLKQPAAPPQEQPKQPQDSKQPPQMKTLTNSAGAQRPLTARERAILAFKGELKN